MVSIKITTFRLYRANLQLQWYKSVFTWCFNKIILILICPIIIVYDSLFRNAMHLVGWPVFEMCRLMATWC